jgi:hypothetical protein
MISKTKLITQFIFFLKKKLKNFVKILYQNQNAKLLRHIHYDMLIHKHINMLANKKQKFLFQCEICKTILSIELEDEEDLEKAHNNKIKLECPCGGNCKILRD